MVLVATRSVTNVPLVGSNLSLEKPHVFFAKQSLEKARVATALATPDAVRYLQDHL